MTSEEHEAAFEKARAQEIWRVAVELQKQVLELRAENEELWKLIGRVGLKREDIE
jgi:hypothetical protein